MRKDYRKALRDLHDAEALAEEVSKRAESLKYLAKILMTEKNRLQYADGRLGYATGQYFPIEYRAACVNALSSALWHEFREYSPAKPGKERDADDVRAFVRSHFPRRLAKIICN